MSVIIPPLACSVRSCYEPLRRMRDSYVCSRGHSYDVARSGYVNLLQPQDRKSLNAGDSRAAVEARAELMAAGVGRAVLDSIVTRVAGLWLEAEEPVVVDLGSGSGETLGLLAVRRSICGIGIDLSTAAARQAVRHFPSLTWVVANADRRLPLLDHSSDLLLSVHARRNPDECRRVLAASGFLLIAVPAADDLVELREAVLGDAVERDRMPAVMAEHARWFDVAETWTIRERRSLDRQALLNLLRGTYRGERSSESPHAQGLERLEVTLASDVALFVPN